LGQSHRCGHWRKRFSWHKGRCQIAKGRGKRCRSSPVRSRSHTSRCGRAIIFAAQTKSFVIDHQSKPNHKLCHGSLEGPENGVYVRGRTNTNVIELPEYWTWLVDDESITVTLTPIGTHQNLYVEKIEDNKVYIGGDANINCFYMINAERKDVDKLIVEY
jgi:hypothetical protein